MADTRAAFLAELDKVAPQLRDAFERAIQDIRSTAQARVIDEAIKRAIETGDIAGGVQQVIAAIQLGSESFAPLDRAISEAFYQGGVWQLSNLPKRVSTGSQGPLIIRFDGRHPNAETWTRRRSAALITEITDDTEKLIREALTEAVEQARPYRRVTRELLGRTDGNQKTGALIGLHSRQARAVRGARGELEALDVRYFARTLRDKRFDSAVRKAIEAGQPLSAADIERITGRYSDRLLRARAKTISRSEGNRAMNAGRAEGVVQMIERGEILAEHVTIIWDATPGPRTRDSHRALNAQTIKWGAFFVSPVTGALMRWPHDEDAPAAETVSCRCSARFRIDWKAVLLWRSEREGLAA
ncbi:phage minor head protein [Salipiger bermudensis]|uniref:phage minor head protein n=1 Tax=Salipiger bermudensis TaxID=344736 RepID=UPI001CD32274|nr:phage minor head protein [Salipiger bermudensis]MCA0961154.1 phage head morphogenesis protein [Salipiger bermudensis]